VYQSGIFEKFANKKAILSVSSDFSGNTARISRLQKEINEATHSE